MSTRYCNNNGIRYRQTQLAVALSQLCLQPSSSYCVAHLAQFQPLTTDISTQTKAITATQRLVTHKPRNYSPHPEAHLRPFPPKEKHASQPHTISPPRPNLPPKQPQQTLPNTPLHVPPGHLTPTIPLRTQKSISSGRSSSKKRRRQDSNLRSRRNKLSRLAR